jgi:hypothetical protein
MRDAVVTSDLPDLRVVRLIDIAAQFGVTERTAEALLGRHGVPLVELSPQTRAVTAKDYSELLRRCRREASANK